MRAAFCPESGRLELREVPTPEPGVGEVLVRVLGCGVCGSDLHWFGGHSSPPSICPGHEIVGEISECGLDTRIHSPGTRVVVEPLRRCGHCEACLVGDYQLCPRLRILGVNAPGGFAEYLLAPAEAVFAVPEGLAPEIAALVEPVAVCVHALRLAGIGDRSRVLVLGAGTIGLLAVFVARAFGAAEVAVTARHPHQRELAMRLGATVTFDDSEKGRHLREIHCRTTAVDLVIETVGGIASTIDEAIDCVRPGGTVSVLGIFSGRPTINALRLVTKEVRLLGSMVYGRSEGGADFDHAIRLVAAAPEILAPLVTHVEPLDRIEQAFRTASDKTSGSVKVHVRIP